jgi:hypothetical protein
MSTAERDAIASPVEGLTIFNTDNHCLEFFNASYWISACDGSIQPGPLSDCSTSGFIAPFLSAAQTAVVPVLNPVTGKTWMDRNLGAATVARASNDCYAYGNLHQWGRGNDGHEDRTSNTASGPVAAGMEGSTFIINSSDWLSTQDDARWNGATKGFHDPCPAGYRVPTEAELTALDASFGTQDAAGAFGPPLKLPVAGIRLNSDGTFSSVGSLGRYWSSTVDGTNAWTLNFSSVSSISSRNRALGNSVRCIKD